jgi:hypothetical protein
MLFVEALMKEETMATEFHVSTIPDDVDPQDEDRKGSAEPRKQSFAHFASVEMMPQPLVARIVGDLPFH